MDVKPKSWTGPLQVLSLDGGGVKGLFSAALLASLEKDLNVHIVDHFDLISGTSTGGIIALALGLGLSPRQIVDFYTMDAPHIFRTTPILSWLKQLFRNKHSPTPLIAALRKCFGDQTLGDSAKRLVIPAYDLGRGAVHIFKTPHHERFRRDHSVPAWQIAMATGAAPTYFPIFKGVDKIRLVDGGVWANNPTVVAIVDAYGVLDAGLDQISVLSIGTTAEVSDRSSHLDQGGMFHWAGSAASVMLQAQSVAANGMAELLLGKDRFLRINPVAPEGLFQLDKCNTDSHLAYASACGRELAPEFRRRFLNHKANMFRPLYGNNSHQQSTPNTRLNGGHYV